MSGTQYDPNGTGNQTVMGSSQLTYDAESRIVQDYDAVSLNTTNYVYDGLGERVSKATVGGSTYTYVYDAFGNLSAEYTTGTVPLPPCTTCYVTQDALGSARMVSDTLANGFTAFHDFAPFGAEVTANYAGRSSNWGTSGNGPDNLTQRYTGAERDTETGLDNMQARYMASMQARFMRPDPAGNFLADPANPQSWNLYSYTWNNPLSYFDPSGLDPSCDTIDCDDGGGIDFGVGIGWGGGGGGYSPPQLPPSVVRMPSSNGPPYGNQGGSCFGNSCQAQPLGANLPNSGINIGTLVNFLNCNALPGFGQGQCSPYVYLAFQKAGAVFKSSIPKGRNFGALLEQIGCPALAAQPPLSYDPQAGDVIVFQAAPGHPQGHVQVYDGHIWISDFKQIGSSKPYPGPDYKKANADYKVYRCK